MGIVSYQHTFSSDAIGVLRGMSRNTSTDFHSNQASWPLNATQHNDFKEIYFNGSVSVHHGRQEFKAGVESDAIFLQILPIHNVLSIWESWIPARQPLPFKDSVRILNKRGMFRI